ncbi:MAG TPA: family 65 glycosyl hydrolase, partial [Spirochaetia bacterium]|nr:family 65 glycosyl hydrolase [Spirochaetia bacterium]
MKKYADRYLAVEPWSLTEVGFHKEQARVTESLMSQANEAQGIRASFEEGYSGDTLPGAYVGGVYEEMIGNKGYKGVSNRLCFMVNGVDWAHLRLDAGGERLDLAKVSFDDFERSLDFRSGLLTRTLTWNLAAGGSLSLKFERLLSMDQPDLAFHRLTVTSKGWTGTLTLRSGLDFGLNHEVYKENYWTCGPAQALPLGAGILGTTRSTQQRVYAAFHLRVAGRQPEALPLADAKFAGVQVALALKAGETLVVEKDIIVAKPVGPQDDTAFARSVLDRLARPVYADFAAALAANKAYWTGVWSKADIEIDGDAENQQGIRFSIFQLEQTFRGKVPGANIGAKGLSGEFYNGNYFWDSEVYCLPYYLFKNPT